MPKLSWVEASIIVLEAIREWRDMPRTGIPRVRDGALDPRLQVEADSRLKLFGWTYVTWASHRPSPEERDKYGEASRVILRLKDPLPS
jgi:hypothetical protein